MRLPVRMPQFGESAAAATVVAWLVKPGVAVKAEQELCEVQTEKSLLTVAAAADGVVGEIVAQAGSTVAVGEVLAFLDVSEAIAAKVAPDLTKGPAKNPAQPLTTAAPSGPRAARPTRPRSALAAATGDAGFISPRVRARLAAHGLTISDLSIIPGSGREGRVTGRDVDAYSIGGEPLTAVRQAVSGAMTRSWSRPLATVAMPCRLDAVLEHRRSIPGRPSLTVYALRALALAINAAPTPLRGRLVGNRVHQCAGIDLAVAVEVDDGVITPVVRGVDGYSLPDLEEKVSGLVDRCRAGRVSDLGDAIATVSNYGTFGITWATPIPLAGQAFILGLGAPQNAPEWDPASKTFIRVRQAELTLTFDHRLADGGAAGRLLGRIVELLQHPERV